MVIRHSRGSYSVNFGALSDLWGSVPAGAFIITDDRIAAHYPELLHQRPALVLPNGEHTKSIPYLGQCCEWLATQRADRKSMVVALGGGVIGDLVGFVAATYLRGVKYIQVPTTLLAQVDSSVGGKVAIDIPQGKNLVGAFYPPAEVLVSTDFWQTLPQRQWAAGMAEAWKYGFILDRSLCMSLSKGQKDLEMVRRCVALKKHVVEDDEFETKDFRAILNFGHTIGHAIEQLSNYQLLHGEAISIGMVLEARLGENLELTRRGVAAEIAAYLATEGLPTAVPAQMDSAALLELMMRDKKVVGGRLAMSLLSDIGACKLVRDIPNEAVLEVLTP